MIETILIYSKPPNGPYEEVHNTALLNIPSASNISFYIPYDGTTATEVCGGAATRFNFTANFCASNATLGSAVLSMIHMGDAVTVGTFLGGTNFTSCAALGASPTTTTSTTAPMATFTGLASSLTPAQAGWGTVGLAAMLGALVL